MKKKSIVLFCCVIMALCACKKSSVSTPASDLEGSWMMTKKYIDTTGRGNINTSVVYTYTSDPTNVYVFNTDGHYSFPNPLGVLGTYTWTFADNNTFLKLTDWPFGSENQKILQLTSTTLELEDTSVAVASGNVTIWSFYSKL